MTFKPFRPQRGATLITALVMLVVLTLLVISAIRSSSANLRIAGNMQMQEEAIAAAQQASEQVLSSDFTKPTAVVAPSVNVDINNDGVTDYVASVAPPVCTGSAPVRNNAPNLPTQCVSSDVLREGGIMFVSAAAVNTQVSWCAAQQWDVRTAVADNLTGANAVLHQGVSMFVDAGTTCTVGVPND
jgi:hypothetical protein